MLDKLKKELENNKKINLENGLENKVDIDYIIERLNEINEYFEVARCEVITAIEDIYNDELYGDYAKELENITEDDINALAWKVEDMDIWEDAYISAREEIYDLIGVK